MSRVPSKISIIKDAGTGNTMGGRTEMRIVMTGTMSRINNYVTNLQNIKNKILNAKTREEADQLWNDFVAEREELKNYLISQSPGQ